MVESRKKLVSCDDFVKVLNDELKHSTDYQAGMQFINIGSGYDFIAPMLSTINRQGLDKLIFDRVSASYTIAR